MKTLWFFVILAAVNGEVCTKSETDDQGNPTTVPSNKWGEAEGDLPEVRIDRTIFIANL